MRPRILLLVTLAETGGAQTYVASLLPMLAQHFDVTVAAHGSGPLRERAQAAGVRFVQLEHVRRPLSPLRDFRGLLELTALIRRERPHIVHVNSAKAGALGRLAAWLARVPIRVYTVHGWSFTAHSGTSSAVYRVAERALRPLTTTTICVAESERRAGLEAGTCDEATTVVIHNGVELAGAAAVENRSGPYRLVTVGRLQAPKDPLTLVRALAELGRPGEAVIAGDGPDRAAVGERGPPARPGDRGSPRRRAERRRRAPGGGRPVRAREQLRRPSALDPRGDGRRAAGRGLECRRESRSSSSTGKPAFSCRQATRMLSPQRSSASSTIPRCADGSAQRAGPESSEHFDLASARRAHLDLYRALLADAGLPLPSP